MLSRASHGARGLKSVPGHTIGYKCVSRLAWGAWIEIPVEWDNILVIWSRLAWGAWIEISMTISWYLKKRVAPRMGRVD